MKVLVSVRGRASARLSRSDMAARARCMLTALRLDAAELSLVLCDDRTMQQLNRSYRGLDRSTDVLAFAQREAAHVPAQGAGLLGDIVISVPTAARQAAEHGRTLQQEATLLLAHGLLHLLGFDHRTKAEDRRMRARTDALIAVAEGKGGQSDRPALPAPARARAGKAVAGARATRSGGAVDSPTLSGGRPVKNRKPVRGRAK